MAKTIGSFDLASLKNLRDDVTQYFWFESDSSSAWGSGAHVTLYPESQFTDSTNPNYMKGQNIIMNTDGFSIRNGGLPMMVLDNDSLDFNAVDTTQSTYTTMASFGLTGAQIGQASGAHSVIDADGQRFYASDGTTQLANIGYGEGQSQGGTSIAPYYTFGVRKITTVAYNSSLTYVVGDMCVYDGKVYVCAYDITTPESWNADHWRYYIGNYSVAEGSQTTASDIYSHAEGRSTIASGQGAHAEGIATLASSYATHAEGDGTSAVGFFSHSEGEDSYASGRSAHAQNMGTIAQRQSQTAIGEYNIADIGGTSETTRGDYVVIIGNGTSELARSNALTVDWDGNITINNHDSEIGHVYSASTSVAISNTAIDHNTDGASISLSAGTYIVIGQWHFNTRTTTGATNSAIRLYRSGSGDNIGQTRINAAANNWNCLQCMAIVELTGTETLKVCGATSRPYTTAQGTYITAVRIK